MQAFSFYKAPEALRNSRDRKSTRLNSSHSQISYAVFCLKKKKHTHLLLILRRLAPRLADQPPTALQDTHSRQHRVWLYSHTMTLLGSRHSAPHPSHCPDH